MKKALGIKVKGFTGGIITGFVFSVLIFIFWFFLYIFHTQHIMLIIFSLGGLALSIWMGYILYITIKKPKIILEYDETYIYFNEYKKITKILIEAIASVEAIKHWDKHHTYEFGDIKLVTTGGLIYKIGKIYDVENVKKIIMGLMSDKHN